MDYWHGIDFISMDYWHGLGACLLAAICGMVSFCFRSRGGILAFCRLADATIKVWRAGAAFHTAAQWYFDIEENRKVT